MAIFVCGIKPVIRVLATLFTLSMFWLLPQSATADDLFVVSDIKVDETDQTAAAAREKALRIGERRAWDTLVQRLADPQQRMPLPEYSAADIGDTIKDFWVSEEKTSPVRYIATLNYSFRPERVRQLLARRGVRFSTKPSPPLVVVPVYEAPGVPPRLWDDPNPWREAWRAVRPRGLVPLRHPSGDLVDLSTVSAEAALAGDRTRLAELSGRYGTTDSLVAWARIEPSGDGKGVQLKAGGVRHAEAEAQPLPEKTYAIDGDRPSPEALAQAATALMLEVEGAWLRGTAVITKPSTATSIVFPLASLEEWAAMRRRLESLPQVDKVEVQAMTRDEVRLSVVYPGGSEQLMAALAQNGLALRNQDGAWILEKATDARPASGADSLR